MKVIELLSKLQTKIRSHNEFLPEENEYDDDNNNNTNELQNQQQILKEQLYSTRLYVLLLYVFLLIIILYTFFNPQTYIISISNPSFSTYKHLFNEYSKTLSCPCSTINVSYESFVSINYTRHPLCSFVNEEWILSFYVRNHSYLRPIDFRAVASAQFEIIRQLCLITHETITDQILTTLNRVYFISSTVLPENDVYASASATSADLRSTATLSFLRTLSLIRFTTKSNRFVSKLRNYNILQQMVVTRK